VGAPAVPRAVVSALKKVRTKYGRFQGLCEERARDDAGAIQSASCFGASVIGRTEQNRFGLHDVPAPFQLVSHLSFLCNW
jgi:hypothetical protein